MNRNRFDPLTKEKHDGISSNRTNQTNSLGGLKFISLNINSIKGKKLDLLAFLDVHNPHIVAIQETKIDRSIATSELFPEACPYNIFRKDRNLHGGGVMFLIHKDIPHMPLSVTDEALLAETTYLLTKLLIMWQAGIDHLLAQVNTSICLVISSMRSGINKGNKLPSVHVLGDFNFKDIAWPDRLNKSGSVLSQSEGQMLIAIMNDNGLEQLVHFPTREKNTLDLILTSLPGQFQEIHSPDKLSDRDVVSGTLKVYIPQKRNLGGRCIYITKEILSR